MTGSYIHSIASMGTVVTIEVVGCEADARDRAQREAGVARALAWFEHVERACSRFDPRSEISRLASCAGAPVAVSPLVFEAVQFAIAVAGESDGAFDPTIGTLLEARGFNEEYRTGHTVHTTLAPDAGRNDTTSYRDVHVDDDQKTITLARPLMLDLGAVAKGLAIDLAARELQRFENYAIDAGGDLYLGGHNAGGRPWSVGIRHPRIEGELLDTLQVSGAAVCTSGDYERHTSSGEHHILDPRTRSPAMTAASVTVIAPSAMVADALGTAAFVLGPARGIELLRRHGVEGFIVTPSLERFDT